MKEISNTEHFELIFLKKEEIILIDVSAVSYMYIVLEGSIQIGRIYSSTHNIITIGFLKQNDWFILQSNFLLNKIYQLKAMIKTKILILSWPLYQHIFLDNKFLYILTFKAFYRRISQLEEFISILSPKTVDSRIVIFFLFAAKYWGKNNCKGVEIQLSISHKLLGEIVGTSRVSITRVLKRLQQTNLIEFDKYSITLINPVFLSFVNRTTF